MPGDGTSDDGKYSFDASRRRFLGATAGASLAALGTGTASAATASPAVTLIHDTHFHGRFGDPDGPNIARYATVVEQLRSAYPDSLFIANGDDIAPSVFSFAFRGEHMIEALNLLDPAVDAFGNHEFDFGPDLTEDRVAQSTFPWSSANILTPDGNPIPGSTRWLTTDVGGTTVGLFGLAPGNTKGITSLPDDYTVLDPVDAAAEAVDALQADGADVIVLASHLATDEAREVAQQVDGLDAIVGDHASAVFDAPEIINDTVFSAVGDEFDHIGRVTLAADGSLVEWERIDLTGSITPDPDMQAIVDKWESRLDDKLGEPVGTTDVELDARFSTNYHRENPLGNLITDAMRAAIGGEVAIQNAGGIRSNSQYPRGEVTAKQVLNILPFGNSLVVLELTGAELVETLAGQVVTLESSVGQQFGAEISQQVSGVQFEWVGHEGVPENDRVRNVYVNGEPLDPQGTYEVTVNSFMAGGGSGYPLADKPRLRTSDTLLGVAVIDYFEAQGHVAPRVEHRMERVDVDVGRGQLRDADADSGMTVLLDLPSDATDVHSATFYGLTQFGSTAPARDVAVEGDRVAVTFDDKGLGTLASGPKDVDLRVFGGYVSEVHDRQYFFDSVMRGTVPVPGGVGVRSWWRS